MTSKVNNLLLDDGTEISEPTKSIEIKGDLSSIILGTNLDTTPVYTTISPTAITQGSNSISLGNLTLLPTVLNSLELPPNPTTLKVNKTIILTDDTNTATMDINQTNGNLDITTSGFTTFNNLPRCSDVPANSDELVNKAYADSIVSTNASTITITDTNTNQTFYPTFTIGSGTNQTLRADVSSTALSYNPSTSTLTATNFNGTVNNVDVSVDNNNNTLFPVFVSGSTTGSKNLRMDSSTTPLTYNPSTGTLTASNFTGNFNGSITNAINSVNSENILVNLNNTNSNFFIPFTTVDSGNKPLFTDNVFQFSYNPAIGTLNAPYLNGSSFSSNNVFITRDNNNVDCYIPFTKVVNTGNKQMFQDDLEGHLKYNPFFGALTTSIINATTFNGSLNGNATTSTNATNATNADNILITSDDTSGNYFIPFSKSGTTGDKALFMDDTTGPLTYNPATSTLTATNFNGSCSQVSVLQDTSASLFYPIFSLSNSSGNKIMRNDGTIGTITYDPVNRNLTSTNFTGNLSGNATSSTNATNSTNSVNSQNILVKNDNTIGTYYPTFVKTTGDGNKELFMDTTVGNALTFDPSIGRLSTNTFAGNSTSTQVDRDTDATIMYPTMVLNNSEGPRTLRVDGRANTLTYSPATNTLNCTTFNGALSGNATSATTATNANNVAVGSSGVNASLFPTFVDNSSGNRGILTDNDYRYNPSTNTLTVPNLAGTAQNSVNILTTNNNDNATRYITFTNTTGTSQKQLFQDDTSGPLTYNPFTGIIGAGGISTSGGTQNFATAQGGGGCVLLSNNFGTAIRCANQSESQGYGFYLGLDGQNNFNAPAGSGVVGPTQWGRINFCINDIKYMIISGEASTLGNVGIRTMSGGATPTTGFQPQHPLDVVGNIRTSTSLLTPQVGNPDGNLNIRVNNSGAGGSLSFTGGTGLLSNTAGGASGQHLVLTINGTQYKIALLNN